MLDTVYFDNHPSVSHESMFRVAELVNGASFKFAKKMPEKPHWYTIRAQWPEQEFEEVVTVVQGYGFPRRWEKGKYYTSLTLNGHYYWTMGWKPPKTTILNRARKHYETPYDEIAHQYDQVMADDYGGEPLRALLGDLTGQRILDVGCGTGWLLRNCQDIRPQNYWGIDLSENMLRVCASRNPLFADRLHNCSFGHWYPTEPYDQILVLHGHDGFLSTRDVDKISMLLAPGGRAVIMVRDSAAMWEPLGFTEEPSNGIEHLKAVGQRISLTDSYDAYVIDRE